MRPVIVVDLVLVPAALRNLDGDVEVHVRPFSLRPSIRSWPGITASSTYIAAARGGHGGIRSPDRAHAARTRPGPAPFGRLLVVLVTAGATGSAVALSTPSVIAALHPAPVADAQPALPRLALGPLVATAPMPTQAGLTTALGKPADAVPARSPASCGPGVEPGALAAHARQPARPRLDREADHHGGRAAHAQPDVQPGHQGRGGRGAGGGRARGRRRPHAHRAPTGKVSVYPDPTRLPCSPTRSRRPPAAASPR